jgi:hypothetical protein
MQNTGASRRGNASRTATESCVFVVSNNASPSSYCKSAGSVTIGTLAVITRSGIARRKPSRAMTSACRPRASRATS